MDHLALARSLLIGYLLRGQGHVGTFVVQTHSRSVCLQSGGACFVLASHEQIAPQ